jgi:TPR repeat protein
MAQQPKKWGTPNMFGQSRLTSINGIYYFRAVIPEELRDQFGGFLFATKNLVLLLIMGKHIHPLSRILYISTFGYKTFLTFLLVMCSSVFASSSNDGYIAYSNGDYVKAIPMLQQLAGEGVTHAQGLLSSMYLDGQGAEVNYSEALRWASISAIKNDPNGQRVMGFLYLKGLGGVSEDHSKAISYYKKAAEQEDPKAIQEYVQILLQGHSKEGLDLIENALIKDKSLSSALVLMHLYSDRKYKAGNIYKALSYSVESVRRGGHSGIWLIVDSARFIQLPNSLSAKWMEILIDRKDPDVVNYPNYQLELNEAIIALGASEKTQVDSMTLLELMNRTSSFLTEREKKFGPIDPYDLIEEGWGQFVGGRGLINEPLAQQLLEEGLRKAIATRNSYLTSSARNNLGVVFGAAVNPNIRNKRLAQVHVIDGADSKYGPDNLIWYAYEGKIDLPTDEFDKLLVRYRELEGKEHVLKKLGRLPVEYRNQPEKIIPYLISKFNENPDYQIAEQIADMYEDNYTDSEKLKEAEKWYQIRVSLIGSDVDDRLARIKKINNGQYFKDAPDFRNSIEGVFGLSEPKEKSMSSVAVKSRKVRAYALVIGNSKYKSGGLSSPENDADVMANKFKLMGFDVTYTKELNRKKFVDVLITFAEKARDADVTVLYYSGHGMQVGGVNYLLPIDVNFKNKDDLVALDGISLNDLIRRNMPGKRRLIFLDACRTAPVKSSAAGMVNQGLAPMNVLSGTLISFATKDGGVAYDGGLNKNSPYTSSLALHISENQDIALILRKVREEVLSITRGKQEPWEYGSLTGGALVLSGLNSQ